MITNYARNIKTKQTVCFEGKALPGHIAILSNWAVWFIPDGTGPHWQAFHLIGEGQDEYCIRNNHGPKNCRYCRPNRA